MSANILFINSETNETVEREVAFPSPLKTEKAIIKGVKKIIGENELIPVKVLGTRIKEVYLEMPVEEFIEKARPAEKADSNN